MIRRIAVGGMGEIFLARQEIAGVNRLVVLKRLLPELAEDPERLAMFVDEARIAANLAHPGIVHVHEFGDDAQGYFMVMEYVPGHHVGRVVARAMRDHRTIPVRLGALVMHEVARALDHAHHACDSDGTPLHIVHRDISPSNVLVSFTGDVKLMDFGIARAANRSHRTSDGSIRGKFAYMAPEQIESTEVDAKSDVFAAGILLWELTLGKRLFDGATDFETIRATLEQPIPRPTSIDPYYPPALESLVMSALDRARDRRLASAADLAAGLKAYLRAQPADRDDLAALMSALFPGEAAESAKLQDEPAKPNAARPTVLLPEPAAPAAADAAPARRARGPVVVALFVIAAAVTTTVVAFQATDRGGEPATPRREVATAQVDAVVDRVVTPSPDDAPVDTPDDHTQVPIETKPALKKPGPKKPVATPPAPPDAAIARPPEDATEHAIVVEGTLHFRAPGEHPSIYVIPPPGVTCDLKAIQTRCKGRPGTYTFRFSVAGGEAFTSTVKLGTGFAYCDVDLSRKVTSCDSP